MGLIVHLTDLHLGVGGTSTPADDRKVHVVSDSERTTIQENAEEHIGRLVDAIRERGQTISALVLSGDITVQSRLEGFRLLKGFLTSAFGKMLPPPERIVATPGNHDVAWFKDSAAERYEHFIAHCADAGFVTPPLDGIDLFDKKALAAPLRHVLIDDEGWFIVPVNSSNWSGTRAKLTDSDGNEVAESAIDALRSAVASSPENRELLESILRFRNFDMPRVSKGQITAFRTIVRSVRAKLGETRDALPIATMHHQLSPVGEREEIKPFESLSNLGRVRAVLQDQGIAMTLHGHKHDQLTMWNTTEKGGIDGRGVSKHEMLVVSGGTIGGSAAADPAGIASIIEITPQLKGFEVLVRSMTDYIQSEDRGARAYFLGGTRFEPLGVRGGHIEATTVDDAYARLLAEGDAARQNYVKNLSITVKDINDGGRPPTGYPDDAAGDAQVLKLDDWFSQVTDWWQAELVEAPRGLFTHGRRLKLHHGQPDADQIAAMTRTLVDRRPDNGRAIATLIDPGCDLLGAEGATRASFPAFCLVQLHIRREGQTDYLDATAYFRKQEMRYWWPVNIAEIRKVMETVCNDLRDVKLGSITTVAAIAVWQTSRSRVSIPAIDRLFLQSEDGRHMLLRMAALVAQPEEASATAEGDILCAQWHVVMEDIVPPIEAVQDSIPIAIEGIGFLKQALRAQEAVAADAGVRSRLAEYAKEIETLEDGGRELWNIGRTTQPLKPKDFKDKLSRHVSAMTKARDNILLLVSRLPQSPRSDPDEGEYQ